MSGIVNGAIPWVSAGVQPGLRSPRALAEIRDASTPGPAMRLLVAPILAALGPTGYARVGAG